jgi:hypothetical protein
MSYPINTSIPAASHTPAADQPEMQTNFNNISQYLAVDHVLAGAANNGQHKQVRLPTSNVPGVAPTDPASVIYSAPGSADTKSQLFFQNQSGIFLLDCVKAFGVFTTSGGTVNTFDNQYNCVSIINNPPSLPTVYTITLQTNAVTNNNIVVFVNNSATGATAISWSFSNPVLTLTGTGAFGNKLSFIILQA